MGDDRTREPPAERFDAPCLVFDLHDEARALREEPTPARHGHRQKTLYKHGGRTIALFVMNAGADFPEHAASGTVSIQGVEGEILVMVDGGAHTLGPGTLLTLPPDARHGVRARGDAVFLLQVSLEAETKGGG